MRVQPSLGPRWFKPISEGAGSGIEPGDSGPIFIWPGNPDPISIKPGDTGPVLIVGPPIIF